MTLDNEANHSGGSNMNFLMNIIGYPLGWIMWAAYKVVPIYSIALIIFTVIVRAAMIPLGVKQQKNQAHVTMADCISPVCMASEQQQRKKQHRRHQQLQEKGCKTKLLHTGNRVDHRPGPGQSLQ